MTVTDIQPGPYDLSLLAGRGPVCDHLAGALARPPHDLGALTVDPGGDDPIGDLDLQTALYVCYELHYRGFPGVDERWEWEPSLLGLRARLEAAYEHALHDAVRLEPVAAEDVEATLWSLTEGGGGRSLSAWAERNGHLGHARELAVHRAPYQLKEADPHTLAMPRLSGPALAAMMTIQWDEYGEGRDEDRHATLFADTMRALGLDPTYGAHVHQVPAVSLATNNLFSLLSLHRRLRGAVVGHLAGFEMNSVGPMSRYSAWMARLGLGHDARRFYDVHVVADEEHQHIAARDLAGSFAAAEPDLAPWVPWGAKVLSLVEGRFTDHVLDRWTAGRSSLLVPSWSVLALAG